MKGTQKRIPSVVVSNNHHEYSNSSCHKPLSGRQLDDVVDDEWTLAMPKKRFTQAGLFPEKKSVKSAAIVENDVARIIRSVAEESKSLTTSLNETNTSEPVTTKHLECIMPVEKCAEIVISNDKDNCSNRRSMRMKKVNEKRKQMQVRRLLWYIL